ncbi:MAG: DEAD/DEAH box helicase [Legionellaceae bacterium]|nr:DEAD/DEAH box helicase [Legionellaceae bacterium]
MLEAALSRMARAVSNPVLLRGQNHHQSGDVLTLRLSDGLLRARVKGHTHQIYDVYMDLKIFPGTSSRCGCERKNNCEHAVAALLALHARETGEEAQTSHSSSPAPLSPLYETVIKEDEVKWYSQSRSEGHDFFSYQLGILIDKQPVSIVPLVADLLEQFGAHALENREDTERFRLPIAKGKVLEVTFGRLKPLLRLLWQYGLKRKDIPADVLKLTRYQLLFMQEAEQAIAASSARWQGTTEFRKIHKALLKPEETAEVIVPPKHLNAALREYQIEGLTWLQRLRSARLSGILADDMGLGKTIQTLAHLQYEKEAGRLRRASLILAPTSVLGNWYEEAQRFTPDLKVLVYHGLTRHQTRQFDDYDLIISTYGVVQRDKALFVKYPLYYLVLDEAQIIKNTQTKTRQIIQQLQAKNRLCLTGTPLENHLGELWSLFHFLAPGFLGTQKQFRQLFQYPIERQQDETVRAALVRRLQPFVLRRSKNQVASELPQKTEITRTIDLVGFQRDLYETIRMTTERSVREAIAKQGLSKSQWVFLEALLKLRQVCCDPRLLDAGDERAANASAKLEVCLDLLDNLIEEGRSVLVFSQFTSMLSLIEKALQKRGYQYLLLTGKTRQREQVIQQFQAGEAPIFLISLRAGGVGLNLTRADTVIHYDPWWNPAVEDQATDRTHRIGQKKPVFVYRLIGAGTVEEVMMNMQNQKRQLFDSIFSEETLSAPVEWTEEEVAQFFMPLGTP